MDQFSMMWNWCKIQFVSNIVGIYKGNWTFGGFFFFLSKVFWYVLSQRSIIINEEKYSVKSQQSYHQLRNIIVKYVIIAAE